MNMPNYLIDTHCHLHDQEWFTPEQADQFLQEAHAANVRQIVVIGTDPQDSTNARDFAQAHPNVFWTYGIHPEYAASPEISDALLGEELRKLREKIRSYGEDERVNPATAGVDDALRARVSVVSCPSAPVAIGEIGLDYHYDGYDRTAQIHLFEQMLQLAQDLSLPVSLHIREAFDDAWPILDNFPHLTGVVHSFTGGKKDLKKALAREFYIGVNGLATYTTPPLPPLEKMLLETDAPFLTPVPFRGTINKPGYVREIATYLSEKLGVAEVNIAEQTTNNAKQLFQFGDASLC